MERAISYNPYNELYHYGIKGQRWGIRRFQNPDGTLTEAGRKRVRRNEIRIDKAKVKSKRYAARAATNRMKSDKYDMKKTKVQARRFQTDFSIAKANRLERKSARATLRSLKYDAKAQNMKYKASQWKAQNKALMQTPIN